jgi:hypothetical protein
MGNGNNYYLANPGDGRGWNLVSYDHNTAGDATCSADTCDAHFIHWSIVRPTCESLESNQIVGPLLTNTTLMNQYLGHVRTFINEVMGNASFIEQIQQHGEAIRDEVALDYWSEGGAYFDVNLSLDPTLWYEDAVFPLLPLYVARVADVRQQLQVLERGTYPTLDTTQDVNPEALCVDWRSMGCPDDCEYEGCGNGQDWAVSSYCMDDLSQCYHGDVDDECNGILNWYRYVGMENREDGTETFCFDFGNGSGAVKISACPARVDDTPISAPVLAPVQAPTVTQEDAATPTAPTTIINSQPTPVANVDSNDPASTIPANNNTLLGDNINFNGTTSSSDAAGNNASTIRDQSVTSAASKRRQQDLMVLVSVYAFLLSFLVL